MTMPLDALEAEVLNLPALQRSHLKDRLISSLETGPEIQNARSIEADRRNAKLEQGKVAALSGPSVLAKFRALP